MLQRLTGVLAARNSIWHVGCEISVLSCRFKSVNSKVDYSKYPKLNENELEEDFMRGSGPGGQSVNKTSNCVFLRHIPTNLTVKCHTHRLASKNRVEARKLLLEKLDAHFNGENAVAAQLKVLESKKSVERKRRQQKLKELKKNWKEREQVLSEGNDKTTN
ncbi:probable peptide chain release factor C12orf65, mitochondrial [Ceratitis capitata]|uniref:probable peptide chain release factor C12orf65, mitochondrial n=1 Tax=Ceratitis capitata TaxID=7213 RepID=UPI000329E1E3|nr:probable peptide chain release factor C12orf65, mitochondrial [Ceratitis capitata]